MNQKALKTLEFDKIIHILTAHAASEGAKEMCRKLVPYDNINDVERAQRETADALRRVYRKGSVSFGGIRDIRGSLKRLEIGGILGMGELLQIMSLLETAGKIRQYGHVKIFAELSPVCPVNTAWVSFPPIGKEDVTRCPIPCSKTVPLVP